MTTIPVLITDKLSKTFATDGVQQHVLRNLDVEICEGDFTVVMGASGSGKTTLLYALSGIDQPTLGEVTFAGTRITGKSESALARFRRTHCGFVFQQLYLLDNMSLMDNAMAAGLLISKNTKAVAARADGLFDQVGIDQATRSKFPAQVSGGEAQRAAIVRALVNSPAVVFADEPTGSLDQTSGTAVLDAFGQVNHQGQTIVMATHDLKSARRGNRVLYLSDGAIVGDLDLGRYERDDDEDRNALLRSFLVDMGW
ncbi:MAG: ABC transporter ATP-binding protein [Micrococcales bacterium]|nr:ABC transporter ATP-binding protein [Micrococcales bacterium]